VNASREAAQVGLSMVHDFENYTVFRPAAAHEGSVAKMLDQVVAWAHRPAVGAEGRSDACRAPLSEVADCRSPTAMATR